MLTQNSLESELERWNNIIRSQTKDVNAYIHRGMTRFKLIKINESIEDFDRAEKLDPNIRPYLWQRGLSLYYAGRFEEGAQQFEIDLQVNSHDVEETVWRYLCIARLKGAGAARKSLLVVKKDPRLVMQYVYELYAGNCFPEHVFAVGRKEGKRGMFYSNLYCGLYYEVENKVDSAKECIVKAVEDYKISDYMWHVAHVHKILRGWV